MKKELQTSRPAAAIVRAKSNPANARALEWRRFLELPETQELVVRDMWVKAL